jgi:hypothetical protein
MLYPDSGYFLIFQVNTRERYREGGNISLKKSLLLEEKGKAKGSPSVTKKLQQAFPSACPSRCQEVLGYLPRT